MTQATLTPDGQLWRDGTELLSLDDIYRKYSAVRQHWRFEHGNLYVGNSDTLFEVIGVPHCGNRFTAEMLNGRGFPTEIFHLRQDSVYPTVLPVRDPRKCLLSHWKRRGRAIDDAFMEQFFLMWETAARLKNDATVFYVDRDQPQDLFDRLGLDVAAPPADQHAHGCVNVELKSYPAELDRVAAEWGYG